MRTERATVVALAGRRVDATGAPPRFPLDNVPMVRQALDAFLREQRASAVVCGGACGVDLLGLDVAGGLGIRRRMVVVGDLEEYKRRSVTDRPGDWGPLFDSIAAEVAARHDLVVVDRVPPGDEGYMALNESILDQAEHVRDELAAPARLIACLVWDGVPRGRGDVTKAFGASARQRGMLVEEIRTR